MKTYRIRTIATAIGLAAAAAAHRAHGHALQVRGWAAACANCHGTQGVAQPGMESLAGKNADDMTKQLLDFKAGRKPATIMHQLARGYSDDQLRQIAAYFAALKK
jgi:cytochrome subunit of sulfide dehydrogenase